MFDIPNKMRRLFGMTPIPERFNSLITKERDAEARQNPRVIRAQKAARELAKSRSDVSAVNRSTVLAPRLQPRSVKQTLVSSTDASQELDVNDIVRDNSKYRRMIQKQSRDISTGSGKRLMFTSGRSDTSESSDEAVAMRASSRR